MERLQRRKVVESPLGRLYFVIVETDPELGLNTVRVYDEDPNPEPDEIELFLGLKVKIKPAPAAPIIERAFPMHYDLTKKIQEIIWYHELPEIQLLRLDQWDGIVRPPKREPEPEPIEESGAIPEGEPEPEEQDNKRFLRIKDWRSPHTLVYDRQTGQWTERDETDMMNLEESG